MGTSDHQDHNDNPDYWNVLLGDLSNKDFWANKVALDFGCGKGRNVKNLISLCDWMRVDGVDVSKVNIDHCRAHFDESDWYLNNGYNVEDLKSDEYDFIMSTIVLQHIPVYEMRRSLLEDLLRVLKPGGTFVFQMGYGNTLTYKGADYNENNWDAPASNGTNDVAVLNENVLVNDLLDIGYCNVKFQIRSSWLDQVHKRWIYVACNKDNN